MAEIKDWHHEILKYLYNNYSHQNVRLNDFAVYDLKLEQNNLHHSHMLNNALVELKDKKFISFDATKSDEERNVRDYLSAFGHRHGPAYKDGTLEHYFIDARLTMDGYSYITNKLRDERQERMIVTQTNLTKTSTTLVGITVAISLITLVKEIWLSPPVIDIETKQLLQKQSKDLHSLEQNLKGIDSSMKVFLERSSNKDKSLLDNIQQKTISTK